MPLNVFIAVLQAQYLYSDGLREPLRWQRSVEHSYSIRLGAGEFFESLFHALHEVVTGRLDAVERGPRLATPPGALSRRLPQIKSRVGYDVANSPGVQLAHGGDAETPAHALVGEARVEEAFADHDPAGLQAG